MNVTASRVLRNFGFLAGILAVIGLANLIPRAGVLLASWGATSAAVFGIFLLSGLAIPLGHLGNDVLRWKAHLLIQGLSLAVIPLGVYFASRWLPAGDLLAGVYLVAVVPTTIATCVIYTTAAGGRTSLALINSVGGNLLGIIVTPFLFGMMLGQGASIDTAMAFRAVRTLCWLALLPFVLGQVLRRVTPKLVAWVGPAQSVSAQGLVLIVIFCSFSKTVSSGSIVWGDVGWYLACVAGMHIAAVIAAFSGARLLRLSSEEAVAATFCAPQKTLAMAIPVAQSFFPASQVSLVLVPVLFHHLFQLTFGSVLIPLLNRRRPGARSSQQPG